MPFVPQPLPPWLVAEQMSNLWRFAFGLESTKTQLDWLVTNHERIAENIVNEIAESDRT